MATKSQYSNEFDRLHSFTRWPALNEAYPTSLSKVGFYYTGEGDIVCCFYCGVLVGEWTRTDLPLHKHLKHSPTCKFALGGKTDNIPIPGSLTVAEIKTREEKVIVQLEAAESISGALTSLSLVNTVSPVNGNLSEKVRQPEGSRADSSSLCSVPTVHVCESHTVESREQIIERVKEEVTTQPPLPDFILYVAAKDILLIIGLAVNPEYANIITRHKTFGTWTNGDIQSSTRLAEAGFYFTGRDDRVRCFVCNGGLCNWEKEDVPLYEHAKWFTRCAFIQKCRDNPEARAIMEAAIVDEHYQESNNMGLVECDSVDGASNTNFSENVGQSVQQGGQARSLQNKKALSGTEFSRLAGENAEILSRRKCKVCLDHDVNVVFLPCSHLVCCLECSMQVNKCPVCRSDIKATVKAFI